MKTSKPLFVLCLIMAALFLSFTSNAQDILYTSNTTTDAITRYSVNPTTGASSGTPTEVGNINRASAGLATFGNYLFYLNYGDGGEANGGGSVSIRSININGTDHQAAGTFDLNGSSTQDLGFVRFAINKNGFGFILAKRLTGNTIYLARVQCNGLNGDVSNFQILSSNVQTSDNSNSMFENGDIAFLADGALYAVANTGSTTRMYVMYPTDNPNLLVPKWTLKDQNGNNFTQAVGGLAFASSGSMYLSTTSQLYFIDQNTTNFAGTGTVRATFIRSVSSVTSDLASPYWPEESKLPVRFANLKGTLTHAPKSTMY